MRGRRWALGLLGVIVGIPLLTWVLIGARDARSRNNLERQLKLARQEGIPTTAAEYAAMIRAARPEDNAASLYRKLHGNWPRGSASKIDDALTFHPSAADLDGAKKYLGECAGKLQTIDAAAKLPRCWFDRDWSQGYAVLFPEYGDMKAAAEIVGLRGSVEAAQGRSEAAIHDADEMLVIAQHAGEEPHPIARLVKERILRSEMDHLAGWAFKHRNRPEYGRALEKAIAAFPPPDLHSENSSRLYCALMIADQSETAAGRKLIGIPDNDVPRFREAVSQFADRTAALARIVKSEREVWEACAGPQGSMKAALDRARSDLVEGSSAFPTAAQIYDMADAYDFDWILARRPDWQAEHQEYTAVWRALAQRTIPKSIDTSDLLSPFDGKPLSYHWGGTRIEISVSGYHQDLKLPPDHKRP